MAFATSYLSDVCVCECMYACMLETTLRVCDHSCDSLPTFHIKYLHRTVHYYSMAAAAAAATAAVVAAAVTVTATASA